MRGKTVIKTVMLFAVLAGVAYGIAFLVCIDDYVSATTLVCWVLGIGGAWLIKDAVKEEHEKRQRDAEYGFHFNLKIYL